MDIILMCLKQQEELKQFFDNFYLEKLYTDGEQNDYCSDIFTVLNCWNGTMYSVFSKNSYDKNDIIAGSIDIFDYKESNKPNYVIEDEMDHEFKKILNHDIYYSMTINPKYKNGFYNLIKEVTSKSEIKTCALLFREPIECPEKIIGNISIKKFFDLFNNSEIYLNHVYLVSDYLNEYNIINNFGLDFGKIKTCIYEKEESYKEIQIKTSISGYKYLIDCLLDHIETIEEYGNSELNFDNGIDVDGITLRFFGLSDDEEKIETYYCGEKSKEIEIFASVKNYKHLIDLLKRIVENDNIEEIYLQYGIDISEKKDNLPIRFLIKKND